MRVQVDDLITTAVCEDLRSDFGPASGYAGLGMTEDDLITVVQKHSHVPVNRAHCIAARHMHCALAPIRHGALFSARARAGPLLLASFDLPGTIWDLTF